MSAKRVLLVDDQRDVTRMLRSALETLGRNFVIVDVPSGEEAILEIARGAVDLLVTDVRLPGISGIDVVRRLRRSSPNAGVIVISGVSDSKAEAEARNLGALAFMRKPLVMDQFIKVSESVLGDSGAKAPQVTMATEQPGVSGRLSTPRRDLGADAVFLVDMQGSVNVRAGDITKINLDPILSELMTAISASLKVSKSLGGLIPSNVHFFDGDDLDIYAANVGQYYALAIVFDGDRGAGQMGPVMRYGRQCADDLLNSLQILGISEPETARFVSTPTAEPVPQPPARPTPARAAPTPPASKPATPPPTTTARPTTPPARAASTPPPARPAPQRPAAASVEHLVFKASRDPKAPPEPKPAAPPPPLPEPEPEPVPVQELSAEELKAFESALFGAAPKPPTPAASSADDFWSMAAEEEAQVNRTGAMSFDEAEKLGLVPKQ